MTDLAAPDLSGTSRPDFAGGGGFLTGAAGFGAGRMAFLAACAFSAFAPLYSVLLGPICFGLGAPARAGSPRFPGGGGGGGESSRSIFFSGRPAGFFTGGSGLDSRDGFADGRSRGFSAGWRVCDGRS